MLKGPGRPKLLVIMAAEKLIKGALPSKKGWRTRPHRHDPPGQAYRSFG